MKKFLQRTVSLALGLALLTSLHAPALASEALGEDLTTQETLLHQETQLSTNVFWSSAYSDLRTENYITYEPSRKVTPIVTFGGTLTTNSTLTSAAQALEQQGYRVVAGINGDFYNTASGLPIGIVITEGQLRSSDGGYHAVGFKKDGSAVLGKPAVKVSADLGYVALDPGTDSPTQVIRQIAGVNKARVSTGGIYLYTYDFNARHTTGNTEAGVDVICSVKSGALSIGKKLTLTVEEVREASSATIIAPDQMVLSVNLKSNSYYVDALRYLPVGSKITLDISAADRAWEDVEYAVGALYSLVEEGEVVSGLADGVSPRTAIGQKEDGTLIFYTIDGRRSGHSVGASLSQVGSRLIELGCETAVCLDGGGSTTLAVTQPDSTDISVANTPSDGRERSVSNQIFLVANHKPSDRLSHFYVRPESQYVLAGSQVEIFAAAVDTNYIPMEDERFELDSDEGELDGNILITPDEDCEITVTASRKGKTGETTVYVVERPDSIIIRNETGAAIEETTVAPGTSIRFTADAVYNHRSLKADAEVFRWKLKGDDIGEISDDGVFTATAPGEATLTVSAGREKASVDITVSRMSLKTAEDFEQDEGPFLSGPYLSVTHNTAADQVRVGHGSMRLDYRLTPESNYLAQANANVPKTAVYDTLNLWVYGDGSGNRLNLLYTGDAKGHLTHPVAILDFTGWKQISVFVPDFYGIEGITVAADGFFYQDANGEFILDAPITPSTGTIYIDQMVFSYGGTVDNEVPDISAEFDEDDWSVTAQIEDEVDGFLPEGGIAVTINGYEAEDVSYRKSSGELTVDLPEADEDEGWEAMRVTITARDASGNIGRASVDIPGSEGDRKFTDVDAAWGDFLYTAGITQGYDDGTYRPDNLITRAQFSALLYRYLRLDEADYADAVLPFADLDQIPAYALPAVRALYTEGAINGSVGKDGRLYFNPFSNLTRAQACAMIGRTLDKGGETTELAYADAASIPNYAIYYMQTTAAQGVLTAYSDGTLRPNSPITRGQVAQILYGFL